MAVPEPWPSNSRITRTGEAERAGRCGVGGWLAVAGRARGSVIEGQPETRQGPTSRYLSSPCVSYSALATCHSTLNSQLDQLQLPLSSTSPPSPRPHHLTLDNVQPSFLSPAQGRTCYSYQPESTQARDSISCLRVQAQLDPEPSPNRVPVGSGFRGRHSLSQGICR